MHESTTKSNKSKTQITATPSVSKMFESIFPQQMASNGDSKDESPLKRKGLRSDIQEIFLEDGVDGVEWTGDGIKTKDDPDKTFYDEVTLRFRSKERKIKPGDFLLVQPEHVSVPNFACRVLYLYRKDNKLDMAHVQMFHRNDFKKL